MENFIPFKKLSKKKKKYFNQSKRNDWGDINPTSHIINSKKIYTRKSKYKKGDYEND